MVLNPANQLEPSPADRYLAPFFSYLNTVAGLFPALGRRTADSSLFPVDVIFLGYFLEHHPRPMVALETAASMGASTFLLAGHPKVSRVVSVDRDRTVTEQLATDSDSGTKQLDPPGLRDVRVIDVARAAFDSHPLEREKVEFQEGGLEGPEALSALDPGPSADGQAAPQAAAEGPETLVLLDGVHTREAVTDLLLAAFARSDRVVVLLNNCRHRSGPFVQAGVVDFLARRQDGHRFRLIGDLGPALATSKLGIVYADSSATETERVMSAVARMFSGRLDPIELLSRETELSTTASRLHKENVELKARTHRRHEIADTVIDRVVRLPAARPVLQWYRGARKDRA